MAPGCMPSRAKNAVSRQPLTTAYPRGLRLGRIETRVRPV
jgi:hypothetical protein